MVESPAVGGFLVIQFPGIVLCFFLQSRFRRLLCLRAALCLRLLLILALRIALRLFLRLRLLAARLRRHCRDRLENSHHRKHRNDQRTNKLFAFVSVFVHCVLLV